MSDNDSSSPVNHGNPIDLDTPRPSQQSTDLNTANTGPMNIETRTELTWTQIRLILNNGAEQTKAAMRTAINSSANNELSEPLITCVICRQPYHTLNDDGEVEEPALTACGHMFGHSCIERWVSRPMLHANPNCPVCRFRLQFKSCKHAIAAVAPYDENNPPPALLEKEIQLPPECSECGLRTQHWHMMHRSLLRRKKLLLYQIDNLEDTMRIHLGTKNMEQYEAERQLKITYQFELGTTEERLTDAAIHMALEESLFFKEIKESRRWHLKADTARWTVPGEDNGDDTEEEGYDNEDFSDEDEFGDDEFYETDDEIDSDGYDTEGLTDNHHEDSGENSGINADADLNPDIHQGGITPWEFVVDFGNAGDDIS